MDQIGVYKVAVVVDGVRQRIYRQGERYFVAGEPGKAYAIEVINPGNRRIEVLESVDGRDVLKDQAASLSNSGMVIGAWATWRNVGWRLNDNEVREFKFGSPEGSVAVQATGSAAGVGVIGVAVYTEKRQEPKYWVTYSGSNLAMSRGFPTLDSVGEVKSLARGADLGTGMGATVQDHVGHTTFERASGVSTVEIQYRTLGWLRDHGILSEEYPSAWPSGSTGYERYK